MLFTLLNWLYILITCFICGFFALTRITPHAKGGDKKVRAGGCVICGIAVLTAYSEYFSLFAGVGIAANLALIVACLIFAFIDRKKYREYARTIAMRFRSGRYGRLIHMTALVVSLLIILVCAYFTASSNFTYDTGTYHAQSIHWIETYGVVRGLAHMQTRLGFNSSYFALCALYSFHFLGQSMHALSGFLATFVMVYALHGYASHFSIDQGETDGRGIRIGVSDFLRLAPFAYFIIIASEITSPATDYGVIWMIQWLIIRWAECVEEDSDGTEYALLSVLSVFLITVKLSAGPLILITVYPLIYLIREKKLIDILRYISYGLILTLPFFIRNYLITGWLVYPFPAIDLFNPDWKVPLEGVRHEADEIVVWARYTKDTALIGQGIREWFPVWWQEQGQANRFLSSSAFLGCIVIIIRTALFFPSLISSKGTSGGEDRRLAHFFLGGILLVSFLFFMIKAPSNRFGYAYILMLPLFAAGDLCTGQVPNMLKNIKKKESARVLSVAGTVILTAVTVLDAVALLKGLRLYAGDDKRYALDTGIGEYLVSQRDYPDAKYDSEEWEGMTIFYPETEGDQIWYRAFPAILYRGNLEGTERRGASVKDGFRLK
ncbi:MAG: hypothetical protein K6A71_04230 [Lachnospiraceae bacterium]|nr:hypothetical protein [Lachnospiraceae bacterium]